MTTGPRQAKIQTFAKLNLTLEVLNRREDNYHNLRTIFQTISLNDEIEIKWTPARRSSIEVTSTIPIENNLMVAAAEQVLKNTRQKGEVKFRLKKQIPMGAGMGGGSSDAAAVLLALPVLTGDQIELKKLLELAASLGSDVPFFLLGGTVLGLDRGTEMYPLADARPFPLAIATPGIHVSTAEAYRSLGRSLTPEISSPTINISQSLGARLESPFIGESWPEFCHNDFEPAIFKRHPKLKSVKAGLRRNGALASLMTGSGSAVFGVFETKQQRDRAVEALAAKTVYPAELVSRSRYRALWRRQLSKHLDSDSLTHSLWPLRSRYAP